MADKQIAALTAATALDGTETLHTVQGGNSRRVTVEQIGQYASSYTYRPVAADYGTPVITGTIASVAVTDVTGVSLGLPFDFVRVRANAPNAGSYFNVPITVPVSPLPDDFSVDLMMLTGGAPVDDFQAALYFSNTSFTHNWGIIHQVTVATTSRSACTVYEAVGGASWAMPTLSIGNGLSVSAHVSKVAPFAATPQVMWDVDAGTLELGSRVTADAFTGNPSSGTASATWAGKDFDRMDLVCVYATTSAIDVDLFVALGVRTR